jgi:hypothetical protein
MSESRHILIFYLRGCRMTLRGLLSSQLNRRFALQLSVAGR